MLTVEAQYRDGIIHIPARTAGTRNARVFVTFVDANQVQIPRPQAGWRKKLARFRTLHAAPSRRGSVVKELISDRRKAARDE